MTRLAHSGADHEPALSPDRQLRRTAIRPALASRPLGPARARYGRPGAGFAKSHSDRDGPDRGSPSGSGSARRLGFDSRLSRCVRAHRRPRLDRRRRRLWSRWRGRSLGGFAWRQQRQRIDVAARVVCSPDPELDIGSAIRLARRTDRPDWLALRHAVSDRDHDRPEVRERDGPPVAGPDRHGLSVRRQRPGEGHAPRRRRTYGRTGGPGDVDSPMARGGVGAAAVVEGTEDLTRRGPGPGGAGRRSEQDEGEEHRCQSCEHRPRS